MAIQMTLPGAGNADPHMTAIIQQLRELRRSLEEQEARPEQSSSQPIRAEHTKPMSGKKEQRYRSLLISMQPYIISRIHIGAWL